MSKEHFVIVIPGLGDGVRILEIATKHWINHEIDPVAVKMRWRDGEDFEPKLERLVESVEKLSEKGKVSIVGTSAGGSAALNLYLERKDRIHKVVNVCGRLRVGTHIGIHSFEARSASSPSFAQSVRLLEKRMEQFSEADKLKIMTIHPLFGDELVPANTTTIEGARNIVIPTLEHDFSIAMALTLLSKPLINFLNERS
jgi:hypothetical protein